MKRFAKQELFANYLDGTSRRINTVAGFNERGGYRYRLGKTVSVCPSCHMRRFKPYVDADGRVLAVTVGRCNRENSCGYHLTPSEYFHDHPEHRPSDLRAVASVERCREPEPLRPDFIPSSSVTQLQRHDGPPNNFECWLFRVAPDRESVRKALAAYYAGTSGLFGGSPVFWQIDAGMNVRTGKVMAYTRSGHRRRDLDKAVAFLHNYQPGGRFRYGMCYFGTHLAALYPKAALAIVESEKTALLLAAWLCSRGAFGERYVVLATGSSSSLAIDPARHAGDPWYRSRILAGRRLVLIPDADAADRWVALMPSLGSIAGGVRLFDIRPYTPGPSDDIADIIERRRSRRGGSK